MLTHIKPETTPKNCPVDFIAQIFKTDAALDIDHWVIREALQQLKNKHQTAPETRLFINLSRATLCDPAFSGWLDNAFKQSGVDPKTLIFQLCEFDTSRYLNQATDLCQSLRKRGSQVAMSHFGLSLNPMNMLERLSVDYVKLDRMLVEKPGMATTVSKPY